MFKKDFTLATVARKTQTTAGGYTKTDFVSTGDEYYGHLKASTKQDVVDLNSFGRVYEFRCNGYADIREGDRLTINGKTYDVKGVGDFNGVTFDRKMIMLNRTEDDT